MQITSGKDRVLYVGITCGLSAPYVAGQLDYCMDHLDRFLPVLIGFNPVNAARWVFAVIRDKRTENGHLYRSKMHRTNSGTYK